MDREKRELIDCPECTGTGGTGAEERCERCRGTGEVLGCPKEHPVCGLCGNPMPPGEETFNYHGFSGPCPEGST